MQDLLLAVAGIRHVGKKGNALEAHKAGIITEPKQQLEYYDISFEDLARVLADIETAEIARATGDDRSMVRRLKRGLCRRSKERLPALLHAAIEHAQRKPIEQSRAEYGSEAAVIGRYAGLLEGKQLHDQRTIRRADRVRSRAATC